MKMDNTDHKYDFSVLPPRPFPSPTFLLSTILGLEIKERSDPRVSIDQKVMGTEPIKTDDMSMPNERARWLASLKEKFGEKQRRVSLTRTVSTGRKKQDKINRAEYKCLSSRVA
jgi:hypothetical protein